MVTYISFDYGAVVLHPDCRNLAFFYIIALSGAEPVWQRTCFLHFKNSPKCIGLFSSWSQWWGQYTKARLSVLLLTPTCLCVFCPYWTFCLVGAGGHSIGRDRNILHQWWKLVSLQVTKCCDSVNCIYDKLLDIFSFGSLSETYTFEIRSRQQHSFTIFFLLLPETGLLQFLFRWTNQHESVAICIIKQNSADDMFLLFVDSKNTVIHLKVPRVCFALKEYWTHL